MIVLARLIDIQSRYGPKIDNLRPFAGHVLGPPQGLGHPGQDLEPLAGVRSLGTGVRAPAGVRSLVARFRPPAGVGAPAGVR